MTMETQVFAMYAQDCAAKELRVMKGNLLHVGVIRALLPMGSGRNEREVLRELETELDAALASGATDLPGITISGQVTNVGFLLKAPKVIQ